MLLSLYLLCCSLGRFYISSWIFISQFPRYDINFSMLSMFCLHLVLDRLTRTWEERRRGMPLPPGSFTLERKFSRLFEAAHQARLRLLVLALHAMALPGRRRKGWRTVSLHRNCPRTAYWIVFQLTKNTLNSPWMKSWTERLGDRAGLGVEFFTKIVIRERTFQVFYLWWMLTSILWRSIWITWRRYKAT